MEASSSSVTALFWPATKEGDVDSGKQMMKVSLSGSCRQLRCMAYSSCRVRGSEAVAWRFSYSLLISLSLYTYIRNIGHTSSCIHL